MQTNLYVRWNKKSSETDRNVMQIIVQHLKRSETESGTISATTNTVKLFNLFYVLESWNRLILFKTLP